MPLLYHTSDDYDREVAVYAPRRWAPHAAAGHPLPLLLAFHGGNQTVLDYANIAGFHLVSTGLATGAAVPVPDPDLFITVYIGGQGFYTDYLLPPSVAGATRVRLDGLGYDARTVGGATLVTDADEVQFVQETIDKVVGDFDARISQLTKGAVTQAVSQTDIYAAGFSLGGCLVYRVLPHLATPIKAAALFSSTESGQPFGTVGTTISNYQQATPLYIWHHQDDLNIPPGNIDNAASGQTIKSAFSELGYRSFGTSAADADALARRDGTVITSIFERLSTWGLPKVVPPFTNLVSQNGTLNRRRYAFGSGAQSIRLDLETAPIPNQGPHSMPPWNGPHYSGAIQAWEFFKTL